MKLVQFNILLSFVFLLILSACINSQTEKTQHIKLSQYEFEKHDSLQVNYLAGLFVLTDRSRSGLYLGLDFMDKSVIIFDHSGEILNTFNRVGSDHQAFGNYLFALGFYNDSTISVLTEKGVFVYSPQGELRDKLLYNGDFTGFQINSQLQILPVTIKDSSYLLTLTDFGTNLRSNEAEFYDKARYFTLINTKSNKWMLRIKTEENIYKNGKYFYPDRLTPAFNVDYQRNELYVKFPLGDKLYTYSLDDEMALIKVIDLKTEHLGKPSGILFDKPESFSGFSSSGFYNQFYIKEDTTFLFYTTGFDVDKFTEDTGLIFSNNPSGYYNDYRHVYTANYCQVFVKDEKLCKDIKLPNEASMVAWVNNMNSIVLAKETNDSDIEEGFIKYYIYRLIPVVDE